jgi:hypothetical protein
MENSLKRILNLLMLLSSGVLAIQTLLTLSVAGPITLTGIGILAKGTVSTILFQIVFICALLMMLAIFSFRSVKSPDPSKKLSSLLILLIAGSLCCVEGIALINLSNAIISGINRSFMITFGVQLFCLGMITIATFVEAKGNSYLIKNIPNFYALLLFLWLIPAAFLMGNLH